MTREGDRIVFNFTLGRKVIPVEALGLEWPPPDRLCLPGNGERIREAVPEDDPRFVMACVSRSQLPDDLDSEHVVRAAEYCYLEYPEG